MAYNGKTIAIDGIVEAAFRDSGLGEIDWEAAIEWTIELLGTMGINATKRNMITNGEFDNPEPIIVQEHRAKLPYNLENLISVRRVVYGSDGKINSYIPMIEATDNFHYSDTPIHFNEPSHFGSTARITSVTDTGYDEAVAEEDIVEFNSEYSGLGKQYSYKIDGQYLFCDFSDGFLEVSYMAFPIDSRGLPVVPDDPKFLQALKYHLIYRCDWRTWRADPASPGLKAVVNDSETRRDFAVAAARNKAHIPTIDKMESIKNQWIRSIPKFNEHANGFKTMNIQERRHNHDYKRRRY